MVFLLLTLPHLIQIAFVQILNIANRGFVVERLVNVIFSRLLEDLFDVYILFGAHFEIPDPFIFSLLLSLLLAHFPLGLQVALVPHQIHDGLLSSILNAQLYPFAGVVKTSLV